MERENRRKELYLLDMSSCSSSEDDDLEALYLVCLRNRWRNKRREFWVRPIFSQRAQQGAFHHLVQELRLADAEYHFMYLRMSKETFDYIVSLVAPILARRGYYSRLRPEISTAERLALTLRYRATGNSQTSLAFSFRMGKSTVCGILRETCNAIWQAL